MTTRDDLYLPGFGYLGEPFVVVSKGPAPIDFTDFGWVGEPITVIGAQIATARRKPIICVFDL